ncbi:MAG: hypothetical protein PW788_09835 [Micavibrio sp.]|nr:hypothetical protein [Micavibrio sp.]
MTWELAKGELVESDVVEWVEAIWSPNKFKKRKSRPWGKQKVIAQIAHIEGEFVKLTVLKAAVIENIIGSELRPHKVGTTITKKRSTLLRGNPERLHWSEEDVRAALVAETRRP